MVHANIPPLRNWITQMPESLKNVIIININRHYDIKKNAWSKISFQKREKAEQNNDEKNQKKTEQSRQEYFSGIERCFHEKKIVVMLDLV